MRNESVFKITPKGVLKSWRGNPQEAVIPEGVVEIGEKVFYSCDALTKAVIPEGVKIIGENAFRECTHLAQITLPDSLEIIGDGAFFFTPLKHISIPEGVTCIGDSAFCLTRLETVVIPKSVRSIGARAFNTMNATANKAAITDVTILGSEVTVGSNAFPDGFRVRIYAPNAPLSQFAAQYKRQIIFTYLTSEAQYPPERLEEYNKYIDKTDDFMELLIKDDQAAALGKLLQLKTKIKPEKLDGFIAQANTMVEIKALLLDYKVKLFSAKDTAKADERKTELALGLKERTCAEWQKIFDFDRSDKGITILSYKGDETIVEIPEMIGGDKVVAIADEAFSPLKARVKNAQSRGKIKEIILPETLKTIGKCAFKYCASIEKIVIPDSVNKIGVGAFSSCQNLVSVTVSGRVKKIGMIFKDCKQLQEVTLRKGTVCLEALAFSGCQNLAILHIPAGVTSIEKAALHGCSKVTIYAPAGSYAEAYAKEMGIPFVAE